MIETRFWLKVGEFLYAYGDLVVKTWLAVLTLTTLTVLYVALMTAVVRQMVS